MDLVGFVAFKLMDLELLFTELPVLVHFGQWQAKALLQEQDWLN